MSQYFDNAATTYIYGEVINIVADMMRNSWYNPNSLYSLGITNREKIESTREIFARYLNCYSDEIFFTGSASEGNAFAINNFDTCIATPYNHHDVKENKKSINEDMYDSYKYNQAIKVLYAMPYVNNETGEIFDVRAKADEVHSYGWKLLVDATQAVGNVFVYPHAIGADFLTFSMHKVHGPKIGVLFISREMQNERQLKPLIYGSQEKHLRGSTEDTANIVASGKALELALKELPAKELHCFMLKKEILDTLKASNVDFIENKGEENISAILNLCFKGITGEAMMIDLDSKGYSVSVGAACDSGNLDPSETLVAMGVPDDYIQGELRISMSLENTTTDAKSLAHAIIDSYNKLKGE